MAPVWWETTSPLADLAKLNKPRFRFIDKYARNDRTDVSVLDVGCGGGFTCEFLARRGARVTGIDISTAAMDAAQRHAEQHGLAIDYRYGTSEQLPFEKNSFESVVCVDVLEHVADLRKTLSEIARVLKPGGRFYFDTINRTFLSKLVVIWLLEDMLGIIPKGAHDWNLFIKPDELHKLMERSGLRSLGTSGFNILWKFPITGRLFLALGGTKQVMYIGVAEKPLNVSTISRSV